VKLDSTVIIGFISMVGAMFSAYLAYRASSQANRTQDKKVDAEAFDRSQVFYEKLLAEADKAVERLRVQIERLQDQLDRVNTQLSQEQDVSSLLRTHVRALQQQVNSMESTLGMLRTQLAPNQFGAVDLHAPPPPPPLPPLPPLPDKP
jgi:peptidoglycan hydrolase CwlO-like protein